MIDLSDVVRMLKAGAVSNGDFICIDTWSGYGSSRRDHRGVQHLLKPDASDHEMGVAVLDALSHSRFVLPNGEEGKIYPPDVEFDEDLYDYKQLGARYAAWVADLRALYGYKKSKRPFFRNMKNCGIELVDNRITIRPSRHAKLEGWDWQGITESDYVVLPSDSNAEAVGAGLRLAFSRCT